MVKTEELQKKQGVCFIFNNILVIAFPFFSFNGVKLFYHTNTLS